MVLGDGYGFIINILNLHKFYNQQERVVHEVVVTKEYRIYSHQPIKFGVLLLV